MVKMRLAFAGLLCIWCMGCGDSGPAVGLVKGTVTLDGEPVEGATVTFMPLFPGGSEATSAEKTDANGHYEMQYQTDRKGVLVGEHQVSIETYDSQFDGVRNVVTKERIPRRYIGIDSILKFTVVEGKNTKDFELTKKKPK